MVTPNKICSILILILFLFGSCFRKEKEQKEEFIYDNNKLKRSILHLQDRISIITEYYENGNPEKRFTLRDTVKEGICFFFYPSGKIAAKGQYKNDVVYGTWFYYLENGNLSREEEYIRTIFFNNEEMINQTIHYDIDMKIDTTKNDNHYFELESIQDTIYIGEPYLLHIRLYDPVPLSKMSILIGDFNEKYEVDPASIVDTIPCNGFETMLSITKYKKGRNEIRGIILKHDSERKRKIPYFFSKNFYVKELP